MKMTEVDRLNESFSTGIYVKVSYKDEIRKFKILDHEKPYDDILNVLNRQYDFDSYSNGNVRLSYIDDDDDEITVSSNREVVDALNSLSKNGCCIKLKIKDVTDESGSDSGDHQTETTHDTNNQLTDTAVKMEVIENSDLQKEIDNVIAGVRGSRTIGEEPVVVPNIFSSFQGKAKRQFEIEEGLVVCRLCPSGRTMAPTIDLNVIKSHTKSDIHIMALTYHVLGEWPALPALPQFKQTSKGDLRPWRSLDNTAAQLLAAKYSQHKPIGQRRKRTSFSPATTLSLESFANSINWKRGESEKINEFAQKHGLTFYQVKVWMNNHRPRKAMSHQNNTQYNIPSSAGFYNSANSADHAREINKVIAALEEPLQMKTEMNNVPVSLPTSFGGSSLGLGNNALTNANTALSNALTSQALGLKIPTSLHIPTTLGLFNTSLSVANTPIPSTEGSPPQSEAQYSTSSPLSSPALGPTSLSSSFFSHPRSGFTVPHISTPFTLPTISSTTSLSTATTIANVITEHMKSERLSPKGDQAGRENFKSTHPLLDNVSLDSAFRPPSFSHNLHSVFTRHGQESTSSGS
ncbi:uncharacterized protein LOC134820489 [Bolinopsis microptera]|uniref:uncharacterized protein LOC134820489 n=1 Tax=Bolinopsis microptera TaxID=2820187 RepID=UPI003079EF98